MRSRIAFFSLASIACLLVLPGLVEAKIPFYGPILDPAIQSCAAGWTALIVVANNIISLLITLALTAVAPLMIGYAGFRVLTHPDNPGEIEHARHMLTYAIIGIVISLAGYLIVDALLVTLTGSGNGVDKWTSLAFGNSSDLCVSVKGVNGSLSQVDNTGTGGGLTVGGDTGNLVTITAFSCKNQSSCQVSAATNAKLNQMKANLEALGIPPSDFEITETGVNTTVHHASGSNNLDMSCHGSCLSPQVKAVIATWPGSVKFETNSQTEYDAMIADGVSASNILGPSWFTGTFVNGECSTGTGHCITASHMSLNQ